MINNNKDIAASIKQEIEAMCNEAKQTAKIKSKPSKSAQLRLDSIPKTVNSSTKTDSKPSADKERKDAKHAKHKPNRLTTASNKQNKITKTKHSTHKTPAQQRLKDLQRTLIEEQINKNAIDKAQRCNNAAHESSKVSISSGADSAIRSNKNESRDLTGSVSNTGLIDADVELALVQNCELFFLRVIVELVVRDNKYFQFHFSF